MLKSLRNWWQQRRRTQQQHAELAGMTDRDWSDLGAGRSEMDYWLAQQNRAEQNTSVPSCAAGMEQINIRPAGNR
ncbi:DUF1127 domain-containing protein [Undibacterium luofuense]|uniref:DUF1127 domain-containing protein n=1 Tax=Undibacterium luofuense TaxID=2828733 RepID=A0A941I8V5_9BURK|nr:DUF1127 domain-containing protein [Undibacterium luofuense]MBR7783188.1 DUF1127 domain-containing protein [Undibacterium luofuense]